MARDMVSQRCAVRYRLVGLFAIIHERVQQSEIRSDVEQTLAQCSGINSLDRRLSVEVGLLDVWSTNPENQG